MARHIGTAAARQGTGQSAAPAPQDGRGQAPSHLDHAIEIAVALGIEDLNAAMRQRVGPALPGVDILRFQLRQQILADLIPIALRRPRELLTVAGAAALIVEGRRDDAGGPMAAAQAGAKFRRPRPRNRLSTFL